MAYQTYARQPYKTPTKKRWLLAILLFIIVCGGIYWFIFSRDTSATNPTEPQVVSQNNNQPASPAYNAPNLQPTIDAWIASQAASYHIVIYDVRAQQTIAEHNPETVRFAASLYKLYIAYLALQDFQTGAQKPSDILVAGQTKKQCVDKMIRSSDSPCGEAMMADMGQGVLNQRIKAMGMTGTFFNGIRTSAADSALILQFIAEGRDLNNENTAFLLDAMRTQDAKFKRGLATGAPAAIWETKVGWNEDENYHDVGIMTLPDSRKFVVAILSQGQGSSKPIADFAATIYTALNQ
jgi:hypothetical protein